MGQLLIQNSIYSSQIEVEYQSCTYLFVICYLLLFLTTFTVHNPSKTFTNDKKSSFWTFLDHFYRTGSFNKGSLLVILDHFGSFLARPGTFFPPWLLSHPGPAQDLVIDCFRKENRPRKTNRRNTKKTITWMFFWWLIRTAN